MKLPKASQYPKMIYIKHEQWQIIFSKRLKIYGITDPVKRTITLKAGMSTRETLSTFIHELLHAIHFEGDFKMKHKLVYDLERGIMEVLMDNFL